MKFLILEDDWERIEWFLKRTFPHRTFVCETAEQAIQKLQSESFDVIFLDHDLCPEHYSFVGLPLDADFEKFCIEKLDPTTGMAVAKYLADNPQRSPNAQIVIHTMNSVGQTRMLNTLINSNHKRTIAVAGFDYLKRKGFKINGKSM